jgi:hypothetical protein
MRSILEKDGIHMFTKAVAAGALLLVVLFGASTSAHAKTACDTPYCSPDTPNAGASDDANVLPSETDQGVSTSGGGPAAVETPAVTPAADTAPAVSTAPSGSLPFTGGDVVGMAVIGFGALALGTLMVLRSKKAAKVA